MVRILFTPQARTQFLASLESIRNDNPSAAVRMRNKAGRVLRRLVDFPESGRRVPEFPELPFREEQVAPCRFFHRQEADTIWVVGVWQAAQVPAPDAPQGAWRQRIPARASISGRTSLQS
jgi:toxin ParE1/3/4